MTAFEWFGIMMGVATLMGTAIAVYSHYNNRALKSGLAEISAQMDKGFRAMHDDTVTGFKVLGLLIVETDGAKRSELFTRLFQR